MHVSAASAKHKAATKTRHHPADASGSTEDEELLRQAIALSLMAEPDEEELLRQAIRISRSSLSDPN